MGRDKRTNTSENCVNKIVHHCQFPNKKKKKLHHRPFRKLVIRYSTCRFFFFFYLVRVNLAIGHAVHKLNFVFYGVFFYVNF